MPPARHVEEHANTLLAQILRGLGIDANAETTGHAGRKRPDFLVRTGELSIVMEAEYNNRTGAAKDADKRIGSEIAPYIIGAISYAPQFREDFAAAVENNARMDFAFKRTEEGAGGWEERWRTGTVYDLAQILRDPETAAGMPHGRINYAVARVSEVLKEFAAGFRHAPGKQERIVKLLQASLPVAGKEREAAVERSLQLAGLILIGAFMFQFALSAKTVAVKNPRDFEDGATVSDIESHWRFILKEINYAAIFQIAAALLKQGGIGIKTALHLMITARDIEGIVSEGTDLMGVLYHEMLAELAKPLGAYYTTIPAAAMLSALALAPRKWDVQWEKPKQVSDFRIADFACGSGTLLAAACGQVRDNVMRAHAVKILRNKKILIDGGKILEQTQRDLLENAVWGYDVLDAAVHLAATNLGLMAPEVDFRKSRIYRAVMGKHEIGNGLAGSLELLEEDQVSRFLFWEFDKKARIIHAETGEEKSAPQPLVDLCIMNPPFVVGRKNALSYSFLPPDDMEAVRQRIKGLARRNYFGTAGLGPAFVALGEQYVKPGGRMAFIMTSTIANGCSPAWAGARRCIEKSCDLEYLITGSNFSYNTNLQECMFVARKRREDEKPKTHALFCILSENLQDGNMGHAVAQAIMDAEQSGEKWGKLRIGGKDAGEFALLPYRGMVWNGISFSNIHLTITAQTFAAKGRLGAYSKGKASMPMRPLGKLARFGSYRLHRYTNAPEIKEQARRYLSFSKTPNAYAGYYPGYHKRNTGAGQKDIKHMQESPNCYFLPLPDCDEWAEKYFSWGGKIVMNVSFGFSTSRRLASLISVPVQGANYQPLRLIKETNDRAKTMVLWLNSTPAIMLAAVYAVCCGRAKVMFAKDAMADMPVLDLDALSAKQIKSLARAFDKIAKMEFSPIPEMAEDPARIAVDDALAAVLELKDFDFASLRAALAAEPIITGK